jgi:hypothetical protein
MLSKIITSENIIALLSVASFIGIISAMFLGTSIE